MASKADILLVSFNMLLPSLIVRGRKLALQAFVQKTVLWMDILSLQCQTLRILAGVIAKLAFDIFFLSMILYLVTSKQAVGPEFIAANVAAVWFFPSMKSEVNL